MSVAGPSRQRSLALAAMRELTSLPVVAVCLDGSRLVAAFDPDHHEHARRVALRVGAVTSTPMLHGLWLLPAGIPVPVESVPSVKRRQLRDAHHFVAESQTGFERLYSPPGIVRAVCFTGTEPMRSIGRAARFTPIVERIVVTQAGVHTSRRARSVADEYGIGLLEASEAEVKIVLPPRAAVMGVPAVYRWWIAELAYESWLQQSAQPVS